MVEAVDIELIDLGTHPLTIGGIKAYETNGEEVMIEVPVHWGSNLRVRVSARLGLAGYAVNIPVEVRDVQVTHVLHFATTVIWQAAAVLEYTERAVHAFTCSCSFI